MDKTLREHHRALSPLERMKITFVGVARGLPDENEKVIVFAADPEAAQAVREAGGVPVICFAFPQGSVRKVEKLIRDGNESRATKPRKKKNERTTNRAANN